MRLSPAVFEYLPYFMKIWVYLWFRKWECLTDKQAFLLNFTEYPQTDLEPFCPDTVADIDENRRNNKNVSFDESLLLPANLSL